MRTGEPTGTLENLVFAGVSGDDSELKILQRGGAQRPHLSVEPQLSSASSTRVNAELGGFADDAAQWLQAWTRTFDLRRKKAAFRGTRARTLQSRDPHQPHILWERVIGCWEDMCHEGAVLDVLIVTYDVHGVVACFGGPVANVT